MQKTADEVYMVAAHQEMVLGILHKRNKPPGRTNTTHPSPATSSPANKFSNNQKR
jgi:hypothetical protein